MKRTMPASGKTARRKKIIQASSILVFLPRSPTIITTESSDRKKYTSASRYAGIGRFTAEKERQRENKGKMG